MKNLSDLTYGIVGFGLMGGSLGKAIRENVLSVSSASGKILAADINEASLSLAREQHIADEKIYERTMNFSLGVLFIRCAGCDILGLANQNFLLQ